VAAVAGDSGREGQGPAPPARLLPRCVWARQACACLTRGSGVLRVVGDNNTPPRADPRTLFLQATKRDHALQAAC
jgi:hypothetical protein